MDPIINLDEKIGKTVGKRKIPNDSFSYAMDLQKIANDLRVAFGHGPLCPKGVYRFQTHEEAEAWTMKMSLRAAKNRRNANW